MRTVVIGASAGGIEAVSRVLVDLSPGFAAAVVVAQHLAPTTSAFVDLVRKRCHLAVDWAEQGGVIRAGHVYIAPPDMHVELADDHVILLSSPREQHARPSIDHLFRSAARVCGDAAIAVLLTGMLGDGVAGLCEVQAAGGTTIVEDPKTAAYPELPARALAALVPDEVLPVEQIGAALVRRVA